MSHGNDILKQLAADARRLRVARKLPDEGQPIGFDLIKQVQGDFEQFLKVTGLSLADVARRMGRGYSGPTLSSWRAFDPDSDREFKGDVDRITRGVNQFMETFAQQATAPKVEGFVETDVARMMLNVINQTIALRAMAIVSSDSGRGKTMTFKAAEGVYPGAIYVRCNSGALSPSGFARMLARALGVRGPRTTLEIQLAVIDKLRGTGRVLLVDEAHQLKSGALEFLRDVHDEAEIPIILGATRRIRDQVDSDDIFYGQFASRVAYRFDVNDYVRQGSKDGGPGAPIHSTADIKKMFNAEKLRLTDDGIALLGRLANVEGMGGLRLCVQIVRVAATVARAKDRAIDARLLLGVLREMHGAERAIKRIEQPAQKAKVA